ncbi:MAG: hypothetical protein ACYSXD_09170 [Planctomycetota bacterium]|jgi:hypothetical protein
MNRTKTVFLFLLVILSGCGANRVDKPPVGYYLNPDRDLSTIGRTALVELANNSAYPQTSADVTETLFQALQKKQVFGLTVIRQSETNWKKLQLDLDSEYTLEQLSAMRKDLNCDAVLIGAVTGFEPFPHLSMGLRLKLVDLADGQLLWALERIWDTTDKTTQERIKKYYRHHLLPGFDTLEKELGTVSSLKFLKFVSYETAETLQPEKKRLKRRWWPYRLK